LFGLKARAVIAPAEVFWRMRNAVRYRREHIRFALTDIS
jgi:hypothetical protein